MKEVRLLLLCTCSLLFSSIGMAGLKRLPKNATPKGFLKPKKFALLVGIPGPRNAKEWKQLRYTSKDVDLMAKTLREKARFDKFITVKSQAGTTKSRILRVVDKLKRYIKHPEDLVLVYFSAHGTIAGPTRQRYIIASDTDEKKIAQTAISVSYIRRVLRSLPSRKKVLILATCYSGLRGSKSVKLPNQKGRAVALPMKEKAFQILSAASKGQAAYEDPSLPGDVYTYYFVQCLRKNGISGIHACAAQKTQAHIKKLNGEIQFPGLNPDYKQNNEIYLLKEKPTTKGYVRTTHRHKKGLLYAIEALSSNAVKKGMLIKAENDETTGVSPGLYKVTVRTEAGSFFSSKVIRVYPNRLTDLFAPKRWVFALSGGAGMLGANQHQTLHPYGALGVRVLLGDTFFIGGEVGWYLSRRPEDKARFTYQRFEFPKFELGWSLPIQEWLKLVVAPFARLGMDSSYHPSNNSSIHTLALTTGALMDVEFWTESFGLRLGGEVGCDFSLQGATEPQFVPAFAWKARLSIIYRL